MSPTLDEFPIRSTMPSLNVGVVGGSLGGLFAAALLTRSGHRVTVFEKSPTGMGAGGAGVAARQEIIDILRQIDRPDAIGIGVSSDERVTLDLAGDVIQRDPNTEMQLSWDYLYEVFREEVPSAGYKLGEKIHAVHPGERHATVEFESGRQQHFDLVIGADGVDSVTRKTVVPGRRTNSYAGYVAWSGLVPESALPPLAAGALIGRVAYYTGPGTFATGYLVPGEGGEITAGSRRYEWMWCRALPEEELFELTAGAGQRDGSMEIPAGHLPERLVRKLSTDAEQAIPFPLAAAVAAEPEPSMRAIIDYVAPRMVASRVALLGDAAVVVRPHAGMAAAKAAGDALALARLVDALPLEEALSSYDAERLPIGKSIASYGRILGDSIPLAAGAGTGSSPLIR